MDFMIKVRLDKGDKKEYISDILARDAMDKEHANILALDEVKRKP